MAVPFSTKVGKNPVIGSEKSYPKPLLLDTMETTAEILKDGKQTKYLKRAKKKYEQQPVIQSLINLNSPLLAKYVDTLYCGSLIRIEAGIETTNTCKSRWCRLCNNKRTYNLMRGYGSQVAKWSEIGFLTLTDVSVFSDQIEATIMARNGKFRRIQDGLRRKVKLCGLRGMEITYNANTDTYHIHYHFLIEGMAEAEAYRQEWIRLTPTCAPYLQKLKKADMGAMMELLKYPVKVQLRNRNGNFYPEALDLIFQTIKGRRTIQPFGGLKKVSEDITDLNEGDADTGADGNYRWKRQDWFNLETNKPLSGYEPEGKIDVFYQEIIN